MDENSLSLWLAFVEGTYLCTSQMTCVYQFARLAVTTMPSQTPMEPWWNTARGCPDPWKNNRRDLPTEDIDYLPAGY